ncbi:MAG: FHA domain-containing protein [Planctomycetota bacterium]|jgi:pSer/pThr/pTyr-binding forkhead associated (FHA) protein
MICVLNVVRGPAKQGRYVLHQNDTVEIGRSAHADISLPADPQLSRRHVLISFKETGFSICDLGSSNGTFVNDERVNRATLSNGDMIRIGKTQLRVTLMENDANPHAEDGVQFSSSESAGADQDARYRTERSISFPDELRSLERTRIAPREGSDEPMPTVTAQSLESDRWNPMIQDVIQRYFVAEPGQQLYRIQQSPESAWGDLVGVLLELSSKGHLLSVFNVAQVSEDATPRLEKRLGRKQLVPLTQTLVAGQMATSESELRLLSASSRCDGLICIGSQERIDPEELKPFANSLSYPSMFGEYIQEADAPIRDFLRKRRAWVLFEWSSSGPLGLFAAIDF